MKTVIKTYDVYSFDELSDESKEQAIQDFREHNDELLSLGEINDTFEKFADIFSINWRYIDYEEPYRNEYKFMLDDNILDLSGLRLRTYILNNYSEYLFKRKYLKDGGLKDELPVYHRMRKSEQITYNCANKGKWAISYYSNIQFNNDCVLTGVCYDYDILQPIYDFIKSPKENYVTDFITLLDDCIYSLCHAVQSEIEYNNSDEAIIENIEANEYEFNEDGIIF